MHPGVSYNMSVYLSLTRKGICENKTSSDIFNGVYLERVSFTSLILVRMITEDACISTVSAKGHFFPRWWIFPLLQYKTKSNKFFSSFLFLFVEIIKIISHQGRSCGIVTVLSCALSINTELFILGVLEQNSQCS